MFSLTMGNANNFTIYIIMLGIRLNCKRYLNIVSKLD